MKRILFTLLLCAGIAYGQTLTPGETGIPGILDLANATPVPMPETKQGLTLNAWSDCGTPVPFKEISEWKTVDTLGDYFTTTEDRIYFINNFVWVEDEWRAKISPIAYLVYHGPCAGYVTTSTQYRIHKITGIRQVRMKQEGTRYERDLTEYEKTVKKFTENKPK